MGGEVGAVLLDESVVLGCDDENGNECVRPGAQYLLRKLRHSTIPMVISSPLYLVSLFPFPPFIFIFFCVLSVAVFACVSALYYILLTYHGLIMFAVQKTLLIYFSRVS